MGSAISERERGEEKGEKGRGSGVLGRWAHCWADGEETGRAGKAKGEGYADYRTGPVPGQQARSKWRRKIPFPFSKLISK